MLFLIMCTLCTAVSCGTTNTTQSQGPANMYLDGGTLANSHSNSTIDEISKLIPTKSGMEFAGWYSDAECSDYIEPGKVSPAQRAANTAYAKWIVVKPSQTYAVRKTEATITNAGRESRQPDLIPISNDFNVVYMARAGYKTLKLEVSMEIKEKDDGYQHIYFYSDTNCVADSSVNSYVDKYVFGENPNDPSLVYAKDYEHGEGEKNTNWETVTFSAPIQINLLKKDIYMRYGASGKGDNDWVNKNIVVTVIADKNAATSTETPKPIAPANVHLNGGILQSEFSNATLKELSAAIPTKEGMVFAGWYSDSNYTDYIKPNSVTSSQESKNTAYAKWITVKTSQNYLVRSGEEGVTDDGRQYHSCDLIPISKDFNVVDLARAGYTALKLDICMDVKEVDDGFQYVFFYSDTSLPKDFLSLEDYYEKYVLGEIEGDSSLITMWRFDHGVGVKDTNWYTEEKTVYLPIGRLTKDIYLRYDASGKNDDDWINKNVKVVITPIK